MLAILLLLMPSPSQAVTASVRMTSEPLEPGRTLSFVVELALDQEWSLSANPLLPASAPRSMLQIAVPEQATLVGARAETLPALLRAAFLDLPFERVLAEGRTEVEFHVDRVPSAEAFFELSVLAYAFPAAGPSSEARLIRQRYRLELASGAEAVPVASPDSWWGPAGERSRRLVIGETAPSVELRSAFGSDLALGSLDAEYVVATTVRSCL